MSFSEQELLSSILSLIVGIWAACIIPALAIAAVIIVAKWKLFQKAGQDGWAAVVPYYCDYVLYEITWGKGLYFLFTFIPFAGIVFHILTMIKLSKAFGKGGGWACGLIFLFPIFFCIMGFSKEYEYKGIPNPDGSFQTKAQNQQGYQNPYSQPYGGSAQGNYQQQGSQSNPQYTYARPEQPPMQKFCPYCGAAMDGNAKFCPKCGQQQ